MQKKYVALLILIVFNQPNFYIYAEKSWLDVGKKIAVAGAALVGIGSVVALCDWLFHESNEKLIHRARQTYNHTSNLYHDIVQEFEKNCLHARHNSFEATQWNEMTLYGIGLYIWNTNLNQSEFRTNLYNHVQTFSSIRQTLQKRCNAIMKKGVFDKEKELILREMQHFLKRAVWFKRLSDFSNFCEHHKHYFMLFESEGMMRNTYKNVLSYDPMHCNILALSQYIKRDVLRRKRERYPYTAYASSLKNDIMVLQRLIRSLAYNYTERISYARQLLENLCVIRDVLVTDESYAQELRNIEHDKREQERLLLLKEQSRLQQEKINILKQQNDLLKQQSNNANRNAQVFLYEDNFPFIDAKIDIQL